MLLFKGFICEWQHRKTLLFFFNLKYEKKKSASKRNSILLFSVIFIEYTIGKVVK